MGINNITLSVELVAALYPDSLVLPEPAIPEVTASVPATCRFLGENRRKICFIVHYPDAVSLPEDHLEFLGKMLGACHCNMADIALLNAAVNPLTMAELKKQLNPEMLFLCGLPPDVLMPPGNPEPFEIRMSGGTAVLLLPSLTELSRNTPAANQMKKKLWISLQKLFNL